MLICIILGTVALAGCPDELNNIKDKDDSNRNCETGNPNTFYVRSVHNQFTLGFKGWHAAKIGSKNDRYNPQEWQCASSLANSFDKTTTPLPRVEPPTSQADCEGAYEDQHWIV